MRTRLPRALVTQVKRHEGYRRQVYTDTAGVETIGYGLNLRHRGLTEKQASVLLSDHLVEVWDALADRLNWFENLNPVRQSALVEMAFNLGIGGLMKFKRMLRAMAYCDWDRASAQALDSKWAQQVGARAETIARQIKTGET